MTYFADLASVLAQLDPAPLLPFVQGCEGTLWLAGNGGSASIAQHWACDLSKAASRSVQALGSNPAVLTAWANDTSYGQALERELSRQLRMGDRLICLSCSGTSENIMRLCAMARQHAIPTVLITGAAERAPYAFTPDAQIVVPSEDYAIIEDCFSAIGHWLTKELACEY